MTVSGDIAAMYLHPRRTVRDLLARPQSEGRVLGIGMMACILVFVGQWPRLSREAALGGGDLRILLGGALFGWVFVMPLVLYALAAASRVAARLAGQRLDGQASRLALFWALLAAAPLWLLHGLVAGLAGPGPALAVVGAAGLAAFVLFWLAGLFEAVAGGGAAA